ncbi:uncharacterized protein ChrSV_p0014 (plasmid) [Chromobacterium vaccinii]|nr:uncharacterized protein ChrSW_p0014 [Chromobacterium vaccinii]QND87432.1 uncharacterized protein ChrSV_p0014 [Chromobacterium vaccinii]
MASTQVRESKEQKRSVRYPASLESMRPTQPPGIAPIPVAHWSGAAPGR